MAEEEQGGSGFTRGVNLWAQTIAIIAAGALSYYALFYQEQIKATAPINLSMAVSVREAGVHQVGADPAHRFTAIGLSITASNPSTRIVYVLDNYWMAVGYRVGDRRSDVDWIARVNQTLAERKPTIVGEHYAYAARQLVASGNIVTDTELKPGETVSRSFVFYVPEGQYDLIDIESRLPSAPRPDFQLHWTIHPNNNPEPDLALFYTGHGAPAPLTRNAEGQFIDPKEHTVNPVQLAISRRQLSLWTASPDQGGDAAN